MTSSGARCIATSGPRHSLCNELIDRSLSSRWMSAGASEGSIMTIVLPGRVLIHGIHIHLPVDTNIKMLSVAFSDKQALQVLMSI